MNARIVAQEIVFDQTLYRDEPQHAHPQQH